MQNEEGLLEKIQEFYDFHKNQINGYFFPKNFDKGKFIAFINSNLKKY